MKWFNAFALSFLGVVLVLFVVALFYWYFSNRGRPAVKYADDKDKVDSHFESDTGTKLSKVSCDYGNTVCEQKPSKDVETQTTSTGKTQSAWSYVSSVAWEGDKRIVDIDKALGWGLLAATVLSAGGPRKKREDRRRSQGRRGIGWMSYGEEFYGGGDDGGADGGCDGGGGGGGGDGGGGE